MPTNLTIDDILDLDDPADRHQHAQDTTDPALLTALAHNDDDGNTLVAVALNAHTPVPVLLSLLEDADDEVGKWVFGNDAVPFDQLMERGVRGPVVFHKDCPPEYLERFHRDDDWEVRTRIAEDERTPIHLLVSLATDEELGDEGVDDIARDALETNHGLDPDDLPDILDDHQD